MDAGRQSGSIWPSNRETATGQRLGEEDASGRREGMLRLSIRGYHALAITPSLVAIPCAFSYQQSSSTPPPESHYYYLPA